ncbi:hypothetical protein NXS19_007851 [Fusarium pseudograminearum]|uniref:RlpA-like protein double-psi beta-barrel domain-containing protein n=1 Tax=Fusarium pseudograminearum (strain CS3096) TaxID=1028729 RepID=K3VC39_FUSPC|nr:hypothetical protein FPSE_09916 [Fusarium pseudograminearum CS3096]EKJ69893.1 hypothetical protein FPSE_09916 [Fusarium pseudograminearum CS3096]KAF0645393.1 hypothetical protein FPSE5266_09916 [Fusarium pseudograminearum]UZP40035.1 hypothetical protein NXS19_007851 [Fusarium pseudograminearum]
MFSKLILVVLSATAALAAPLHPRTLGSITFYNPGKGACEETHGDADMVAAIGRGLYDSGDYCGKTIKVTGEAGEAIVTVVDRCDGCADNDLDISPAAFEQAMGDKDQGRVQGEWNWV